MANCIKKSKIISCLLILLLAISILPVTASAEPKAPAENPAGNPLYTFYVSNTIIGDPDDKDSHEFSFIGKIQGGFFRNAVAGDYWYGTSDIVYEGLKIYRDSFEYKKKRIGDGSLTERGTITPNGYGMFRFTLKHDETIEFSVKNIGKMNFYLYQMPDEEYSTKAVLDNIIFAKSLNVKTGQVIGVGGIPGGMETRYYEENQDNFSTEYAPRLQNLAGDTKIDYYNTSTVIKKTYTVSYEFSSKARERQLPQEVLDLLPAGKTGVKDGTRVVFEMPEKTEVKVDGGRWIFEGYIVPQVVISGEDVLAEGIWAFEEDVIAETFEVSYDFTSTTEGKELPEEVIELMPKEIDVEDGTMVTALMPEKRQVAVEGGKWIFKGYRFYSATVSGNDIIFVGEWIFMADVIPPQKPNEEGGNGQATVTEPSKPGPSSAAGSSTGSSGGSSAGSSGDSSSTGSAVERGSLEAGESSHEQGALAKPEVPAEAKPSYEEAETLHQGSENTGSLRHLSARSRYEPIFLALMVIAEALLYASIMSDVRVLRWYKKKKRINMVIK